MSSDAVPSAIPSPLSEADGQILRSWGVAIIYGAVGVIFETTFLSAYGIFFVVALWTIFRRGLKSRSSFIMLCVVIYLYISSVTLWALNVSFHIKRWYAFLIDDPTMPLEDRTDVAYDKISALGTPMEAIFMFNMVVGDSVVIWRAWVLYQRQRFLVFVPIFFLVMSFIFCVIDLSCLTGAGWGSQTTTAEGGGVCTHAELISWAFSLGTNVTCTLLIGMKAWTHRRMTQSLHVVNNPRRMSTDRILSLFVESGFIYCLFWCTQLILFFDVSVNSGWIFVYQMFAGMGDQISGMYPTLIIVIVNLHYTIWDDDASVNLNSSLGHSSGGGPNSGNTSTLRWASNVNSKRSGTTESIGGMGTRARSVTLQLGNEGELEGTQSAGEIPMFDIQKSPQAV